MCSIRSQKAETDRVRMTSGENLTCYPGSTSTPSAGTTSIKTHWNSVTSTTNAKHYTIDIKDFYLKSKIEDVECMRITHELMPQDIITLYNVDDIAHDNGFIYIEIQGGVCGFPN